MKPRWYILKFMITAIAVICFFGCNNNLDEVRKMSIASNEPFGEVKNLMLKHTDSGKLKLTLQGKKMLDFSNDAYPYTEFPDGVQLNVFNPQDSTLQTQVNAKYGIMYSKTKLVELIGDVTIKGEDGTIFKTKQLYWDQKAEWIFTDNPSTALLPNGSLTTQQKLDAAQDLTLVRARNTNDTYKIDQQNE